MVSENLDGTRRIDVRQSEIDVPIPPRPKAGETVGPKSIFTEWAQQQNVYFAELLRYYPEETFYQYCLLQSQARYGVTPPPLPKPAPDNMQCGNEPLSGRDRLVRHPGRRCNARCSAPAAARARWTFTSARFSRPP